MDHSTLEQSLVVALVVAAHAEAQSGCLIFDHGPFDHPGLTQAAFNPETGHLYFATTTAQGYFSAEAVAATVGGHLVSIGSAGENSWLVSQFGGGERFWIGLTDVFSEGGFQWLSGEPATSYKAWAQNEPNDCDPTFGKCTQEDLVLTNWFWPGAWNDVTSSNPEHAAYRALIEVPIYRAVVYTSCPLGDSGHTWLQLIDDEGFVIATLGFYPKKNPWSPDWFDPLLPYNGDFHDDSNKLGSYKVEFALTEAKWQDLVHDLVTDLLDPPIWNAITNNCTTWVADKLFGVGIVLPEHTLAGIAGPQILCKTLSAGAGCATGSPSSDSSAPEDSVEPLTLALDGILYFGHHDPAGLAVQFGTQIFDLDLGVVPVRLGDAAQVQINNVLLDRAVASVEWEPGVLSVQQLAPSHLYSTPGVHSATVSVAEAGSVQRFRAVFDVSASAASQLLAVTAFDTPAVPWDNPGTFVPPGSIPEPGAVIALGGGCGGASTTGLSLTTPVLGSTSSVLVYNAPPSTPGVLALGLMAEPPLYLGWGCSVFVELSPPPVFLPVIINSTGAWVGSISIPSTPALLGSVTVLQAGVLSPQDPLGMALTHVLVATIGE